MIKAVLFDVDGVLVDSFDSNLAFFRELVQKAGYPPPNRNDYKRLFHLSMYDLIKIWTKTDSQREIDRVYSLGMDRDLVSGHKDLLKIHPMAQEIIIVLSKKYMLGIVSSRQVESIYKLPLVAKHEKYFSVIIGYEDTIEHKPHPEPLFLAAQKMEIDPGEIVYIGDTQSDINAAHAAGMWNIHFSEMPLEIADASTYSFEKIPEIIEQLQLLRR